MQLRRAGVPITPLSSQSQGTEGSRRCSVMTKDHSSQQHGQQTSCRGPCLFITCVFFPVTPHMGTQGTGTSRSSCFHRRVWKSRQCPEHQGRRSVF